MDTQQLDFRNEHVWFHWFLLLTMRQCRAEMKKETKKKNHATPISIQLRAFQCVSFIQYFGGELFYFSFHCVSDVLLRWIQWTFFLKLFELVYFFVALWRKNWEIFSLLTKRPITIFFSMVMEWEAIDGTNFQFRFLWWNLLTVEKLVSLLNGSGHRTSVSRRRKQNKINFITLEAQ